MVVDLRAKLLDEISHWKRGCFRDAWVMMWVCFHIQLVEGFGIFNSDDDISLRRSGCIIDWVLLEDTRSVCEGVERFIEVERWFHKFNEFLFHFYITFSSGLLQKPWSCFSCLPSRQLVWEDICGAFRNSRLALNSSAPWLVQALDPSSSPIIILLDLVICHSASSIARTL